MVNSEDCTEWNQELNLCAGGQEYTNFQATTLELCIQFPGLPQILQRPESNLLTRSQIFLHKTEILHFSTYCLPLMLSVVRSFSKKRLWNRIILNQMISAVCNGKSSSRIGNNWHREPADNYAFTKLTLLIYYTHWLLIVNILLVFRLRPGGCCFLFSQLYGKDGRNTLLCYMLIGFNPRPSEAELTLTSVLLRFYPVWKFLLWIFLFWFKFPK